MLNLRRTKQCDKCPWRVATNPCEIPNGYCKRKHQSLRRTIAEPGSLQLNGKINAMACHESNPGDEDFCVGWLHHQLGVGNNITLRMLMMKYRGKLEVIGEQHETFEDTLP